jgi:TonB family protein
VRDPVRRPGEIVPLSAALEALVLRCLEKRPEQRFRDGAELLAALARLDEAGSGVDALAPTIGVASGTTDASRSGAAVARTASGTSRPSPRAIVAAAAAVAAVAAVFWRRPIEKDAAVPSAHAVAAAPSESAGTPASTVGAVWICEAGDAGFGYRCSGSDVAWCDRQGRKVACCARGLVAASAEGACECPPGGAIEPSAIESGCAKAPPRAVLDAKEIQRIIGSHMPRLGECFRAALGKNASLKGQVSLALRISPSGELYSLRIQRSSLPSASAQACLIRVAEQMRFPPPAGTEGVTVSYPLVFSP